MARRSLVELAQTLNLEAAAENIWRNTIASSPARSRILSAAGASVTDDDAYRSAAYAGARPELPVPEVLDEYGIVNARQGETNFWGSTAVSIDRLAMYKEADVICFDHGNNTDMNALMATPLWQAMPFVRAGRFHRVPAVWFYGATLSTMHFVRIWITCWEEKREQKT